MRLIFVIGMHRSGTSCLTGLLENAGVTLGEVVRSSAHNLKGNNENRRAMKLNGEVMEANGGTWDSPPTGEVKWTAAQEAEAEDILRGLLKDGHTAALKDPRCVFTGEGWRRVASKLGADLANIGTFRRPEKVVGSLRTRDDSLDEDHCYKMWESYNEKALKIHAAEPFPIVDFDLSSEDYMGCVTRAFELLGLPAPTGEVFFTEDLRRQGDASSSHPELEPLYARLKKKTA